MSHSRFTHLVPASSLAILWVCACQAAEANLQEDVERVLAAEGMTGIAWVLIDKAGEPSIGTAGVKDERTGLAFDPDTRFHVGSLTKALVATGVLQLVTEGRIELDSPVLQYLPDHFADSTPVGFSAVTVRHLLDHTAGLNDAHLWQLFSERADPDSAITAAIPDPKSQLRIRSQPGARFSYSNMGYTLLGMVIESVVGARYENYLDEHLLTALAMHDSTFMYTTQEGDDADPKLAWGHVDDRSRYGAAPTFLRPAGQFTTTIADLSRFAQFLLGDGVVDGRTLVDSTLMRSRGKPYGTEAANAGLVAGYALGLGRRDRHGVVGYCHGGNITGFVAMLCIFPAEQKAFAYSVNTDSETADYGRLDKLLIESLNISEAPTPPTVSASSDTSEWHGHYVLSPNRFQMFEYLDTVFSAIRISADGENIVMTSMQQGARKLRPVGKRLYSANDRATTSHVLIRDQDGAYLVSDGFRTYAKTSTAYLVGHWTSILLGLAGLVWLLVSGVVSLVRYRAKMFHRPEAPAFIASALLLAPIPLFLTQSYMSMGDLTVATGMLAAVSALLPIGMLITVLLIRKEGRATLMNIVNAAAAAFVLQWCVVLFTAGLVPLRLWA